MGRTSRASLRHFLLCGFAICAPAYAGTITYFGSFTTASNTATYSITTDGVLGVLALSDIVSVSFSDTGSVGFSTLVASGAEIKIVGNDLSATASTLAFNFYDTNVARFIFGGPSFNPYIAFETSAQNFNLIPPREIVNTNSVQDEIFNPVVPGNVIAQTPEPGTWVTSLGGSIILALAASKRRRQERRSWLR